MYIGQVNLPAPTQDSSNPVLSGYQQGIGRRLKRTQLKKAQTELPYVGPEAAAKLLQAQLGNQRSQAQLPYAGPQAQAQLQGTQLGNQTKAAQLPYIGPEMAAKIAQTLAMSNFYNMGGGRGSTGSQDDRLFQQNVGNDNPQLQGDPTQIRGAANQIRQGIMQMPDGTPLKMSPTTKAFLDRATKSQFYGANAAPLINANQADAEIKAIDGMSQADLAPYGTTLKGYSPQQIIDSFRVDPQSQQRLGHFIAGQTMQLDKAMLRNRMQSGPMGVRMINELMNESMQHIKSAYPRLSGQARQAAADRIGQYFDQIISARNKVGVSPTMLLQQGQQPNSAQNSAQTSASRPIINAIFRNGQLERAS